MAKKTKTNPRGAGRNPDPIKKERVQVTLKLFPAEIEQMNELVKRFETRQATYITNLVLEDLDFYFNK